MTIPGGYILPKSWKTSPLHSLLKTSPIANKKKLAQEREFPKIFFKNQGSGCVKSILLAWPCVSEMQGGVGFGSKVGQGGTKWDKSRTFSDLGEPEFTEIWSHEVPDLSHLGPIWPTSTLGPTLTSLIEPIVALTTGKQMINWTAAKY